VHALLIFKICAWISLSLWIGGLVLWTAVVTPAAFRCFKKEEAGRFLRPLFPAVDRFLLVWALVAAGAIFLSFWNQHLSPQALALEVPVGVMSGLTVYLVEILHPQIRDLSKDLADSKYQGTAHLEKIRFAFNRLHRLSVRLHVIILTLGFLSLGLCPRVL